MPLERLPLERLRSEVAALSPQRRLAMLTASPMYRGDLLTLVSLVGYLSRRLPADGRRAMSLALAREAFEIEPKMLN